MKNLLNKKLLQLIEDSLNIKIKEYFFTQKAQALKKFNSDKFLQKIIQNNCIYIEYQKWVIETILHIAYKKKIIKEKIEILNLELHQKEAENAIKKMLQSQDLKLITDYYFFNQLENNFLDAQSKISDIEKSIDFLSEYIKTQDSLINSFIELKKSIFNIVELESQKFEKISTQSEEIKITKDKIINNLDPNNDNYKYLKQSCEEDLKHEEKIQNYKISTEAIMDMELLINDKIQEQTNKKNRVEKNLEFLKNSNQEIRKGLQKISNSFHDALIDEELSKSKEDKLYEEIDKINSFINEVRIKYISFRSETVAEKEFYANKKSLLDNKINELYDISDIMDDLLDDFIQKRQEREENRKEWFKQASLYEQLSEENKIKDRKLSDEIRQILNKLEKCKNKRDNIIRNTKGVLSKEFNPDNKNKNETMILEEKDLLINNKKIMFAYEASNIKYNKENNFHNNGDKNNNNNSQNNKLKL